MVRPSRSVASLGGGRGTTEAKKTIRAKNITCIVVFLGECSDHYKHSLPAKLINCFCEKFTGVAGVRTGVEFLRSNFLASTVSVLQGQICFEFQKSFNSNKFAMECHLMENGPTPIGLTCDEFGLLLA